MSLKSTYRVTFSQYSEYEVEADSETEAIEKAHKLFVTEMSRPVAHTLYDEVETEELDDEESAIE